MKKLIIFSLFLQMLAYAAMAQVVEKKGYAANEMESAISPPDNWIKGFNDGWNLEKPAGYMAQGTVEAGRTCIQINTIKQPTNEWATAKTIFDGETGTYDVILTSLQETDGECSYKVIVDGKTIMEYNNPVIYNTGIQDYTPYTAGVKGIQIPKNATIQVDYKSHSNGLIPEHDAFAWARGRWRSLSIGNCSSVAVDTWIAGEPAKH